MNHVNMWMPNLKYIETHEINNPNSKPTIMKTLHIITVILMISVISQISYGQAIRVNSNGDVGINGGRDLQNLLRQHY